MKPSDETEMSVGPKSPLFPHLAASGVACASSNDCEQGAADDTQDAEALGLDEDHTSENVTQQIKHKSNVAPRHVHGDQVSNKTTSGIGRLPHHLPKEGQQIFHAMKPQPSPTCSHRQNHLIGRFCCYCRGIEMPWGDRHPIALDNSGEMIHVAPQGALLEGVNDVTAPDEITQLAVLIELRIQLQSPRTIPGCSEAIHMFPGLPDVARRISDLVQELKVLADESEREQVPNWPNALHDLLREPTLSRDQYFERAIREWNLKPVNEGVPRVKAPAPAPAPIIPTFRLSTQGHRGSQVTLTREDAITNEAKTHGTGDVEELTHYLNRNESRGAGYVQFTIDFVDWLRQGAHGTGRPAPQWGPHYVQQYHSAPTAPAAPRCPPPATGHESSVKNPPFCGQLNFIPRRNSEPNATPRCSEELSEVEEYDSNDGEDYVEPSFRTLPEVKKNTPCRPGVEWQFIEGSDLENAELGKPDPSKFYLTRVNVHDPLEIDVRQFCGIAGFDWNDPSDIKALNKSRAQNRHRVQGKIAETRIPWTKMEKDCLLEEVQEAVNSGLDRHTIDWDDIASRLQERFDRVLQKKGAKLAPGVDRQPAEGKKDRTLKTSRVDRTGYYRSGSATETQALKYPDILQIINQATGIGGKGGRGLLRGSRRSFAQMKDGMKDEEDDRPSKKNNGISRRFTTSPSPRELKKHEDDDDDDDDDDEDEGPFHQPKKQLAMPSAFDSRFTQNKAKQSDANSGKE